MTQVAAPDAYGVLTEPATLTLQRLLPGSIDRVWAYLTESDLRRQWLAAGTMEMRVGAPVELVWRNNELMEDPGQPPEGFGGEHRMESEITELDPPFRLSISWGSTVSTESNRVSCSGGGRRAREPMVATLAPWLWPSTCSLPLAAAKPGASAWFRATPRRSPLDTVRDSEIRAASGLSSVAD